MSGISLEQALDCMYAHVKETETEEVSLDEAISRVLAEDIVAPRNQPPFPRSAMDGYAADVKDLEDASKDHPAELKVTGKICAGDEPVEFTGRGTAVRIMTGAPIPNGATGVVRQEDTDYGEQRVTIFCKVMEHQNCCPAGEDFYSGEILVKAGDLADASVIASAAACGYKTIMVKQKVKVAILSSGSELCQPGETLKPGKIYDSNLAYLKARCTQLGYKVTYAQTVTDQKEEIIEKMKEALLDADVLVTTGGVSVGEKDLFPLIMEEDKNAQIIYHGLDVKPGMPTMFSKVGGKPVLSLSGNPFSAIAVFELLGTVLLAAIQGRKESRHRKRRGKMKQEFSKSSPCRRILRGYYDGERVFVSGNQRNGQLKAGIGCNCLVEVPAGSGPIKEGEEVELYLI